MTMRRSTIEKGSTLIELAIYLGLASGILLGVGVVAMNVLDEGAKGDAIAEVRYGASYALGAVVESVRAAQSVSFPLAGATGTSIFLVGTSSSTDPIEITYATGTLMLRAGTSSPYAIIPNTIRAENVVFEHLAGPFRKSSIRMTITLSAADADAAQQFQYRETFTRAATVRTLP